MRRMYLVVADTDDNFAATGWDIAARLKNAADEAHVLELNKRDLVPSVQDALDSVLGPAR